MNRNDFMKFMPKPSNEDVILYDTSLKDLVDVDVQLEYSKSLPIYLKNKEEFLKLDAEIKTYKYNINNIYLFNPSWSEEDYLRKLRDDKKTYSTLYHNIKSNESNIEVLNKKLIVINDKIKLQLAKEEKERQDKFENISEEINECKENLIKYKDLIEIHKKSLKAIDEQIKESKGDLKLMKLSLQRLKSGNYECICCGQMIPKNDKSSDIFNRLSEKVIKISSDIDELNIKKDNVEKELAYYENEISKIKAQLNNNIKFKKDYKKSYIKKSLEVLKLEALRDEILTNIEKCRSAILHDSNSKSDKFKELKNRIKTLEYSLENLKSLKSMKIEMEEKISLHKTKKEELIKLGNLIKKYISFLTIFYKIYEQKASEYCGREYKFKIFRVDECNIIEIFEIYYNDVEYTEIPKKEREEIDKTLIEKFSIYF